MNRVSPRFHDGWKALIIIIGLIVGVTLALSIVNVVWVNEVKEILDTDAPTTAPTPVPTVEPP